MGELDWSIKEKEQQVTSIDNQHKILPGSHCWGVLCSHM